MSSEQCAVRSALRDDGQAQSQSLKDQLRTGLASWLASCRVMTTFHFISLLTVGMPEPSPTGFNSAGDHMLLEGN